MVTWQSTFRAAATKQRLVEIRSCAIQAAAISDRRRQINRSGQQIRRSRHDGAGMNLRRVGQHEIEDAGEVRDAANHQSGSGHFLGRFASDRDASFDREGRKQQNPEQSAAGEPAVGNGIAGRRGDQHAAIERHARASFDQARQHETECKDERNSIVSATEANQGIRCESEADEASSHLQIGVEKGVGCVRGIAQNPQGDDKRTSGDRPKKDEAEAMKMSPKTKRAAHNSPK